MTPQEAKIFIRWKKARPVLASLGFYSPMPYQTQIVYQVWPAWKFFPIWAYQNHKAIIEFVKNTNGDQFDEEVINDTANYLWERDPKCVERNLN